MFAAFMEADAMTSLLSGATSTSGASSGGSSVAGPFFPPPQSSSSSPSSSSFLPPARRCWNGGSSSNNNNQPTTPGFSVLPNVQQQRKRPGCHHCCIHQSFEDQEEVESEQLDCQQPLDLSLPKFKVRQHWSGGSIVHESAAVQCQCSPVVSRTTTSFNVSVTVQPTTTTTTQRWQIDQRHHHHHPPENWLLPPAEQLRLRIDVPPHNSQNNRIHHHRTHRKTSVSSSEGMDQSSSGGSIPDDDYQKLSITENQLRLSGFYYRNMSWKESIQLLQNTPVRPSSLVYIFLNNGFFPSSFIVMDVESGTVILKARSQRYNLTLVLFFYLAKRIDPSFHFLIVL